MEERGTPIPLQINLEKAQKFLDVIDPNRKEWFFQSFPTTDHFKGTLKQAENFLTEHSQDGIYFMVNEWEADGLIIPSNDHIVKAQHLFIDIDRKHKIPDSFHVEPSLIVQTNAHGQQIYWKIEEPIPLSQFSALQKNLIERYDSDKIHDPRRLMRLPYTWNCKYEEPHLVKVIKANAKSHSLFDVAVPQVEAVELTDTPFSDPSIESFNSRVSVRDVLLRNGYLEVGQRFLAPNSTSNIPGVTILEDKVWSHQESCKLSDGKLHDSFDCMRILECDGDWTEAKKRIEKPVQATKLVGYNVHEFISLDLPPREYIVDDFIAKGDLCMIYGETGHGKSILTHFLAQCLSAGVDFGPYKIHNPRKVILIDGEMPAVSLQEKWKQNYDFLQDEETFDNYAHNLITVSALLQPNGMDAFNTPQGRESFWELINEVNPEVVMLDNLLTLFSMEDTNRSEEWTVHVQPMLIELRRRNIAVWMCHHAGKSGSQYGTMAKTIMLDVILKIEHEIELGNFGMDTTSFKWSFDKSRHLFGKAIQPIVWTYQDADMKWDKLGKDNKKDLVVELFRQGKTQAEIVKETGIPKSTVSRNLNGISRGTSI